MTERYPDENRCYRCRICGTKTPLGENYCSNYSCGADLLIYGEIVSMGADAPWYDPQPQPNPPEPPAPEPPTPPGPPAETEAQKQVREETERLSREAEELRKRTEEFNGRKKEDRPEWEENYLTWQDRRISWEKRFWEEFARGNLIEPPYDYYQKMYRTEEEWRLLEEKNPVKRNTITKTVSGKEPAAIVTIKHIPSYGHNVLKSSLISYAGLSSEEADEVIEKVSGGFKAEIRMCDETAAEELIKELDKIGVYAYLGKEDPDSKKEEPPTPLAPETKITEYCVVLRHFGANKVKVIAIVREYTGMGLKEAKEFVENAPSVIHFSQEKAANECYSRLKDAGAWAACRVQTK